MGIQITKIDDKAEGFTVEFTEITQRSYRFPKRPIDKEATAYAMSCVNALIEAENTPEPEPEPLPEPTPPATPVP